MVSSLAIKQQAFEHEVPHSQRREAAISSGQRRAKLLAIRKSVSDLGQADFELINQPLASISLNGKQLPIVTNGFCNEEDLKNIDMSDAKRFDLQTLLDVYTEIESDYKVAVGEIGDLSRTEQLVHFAKSIRALLFAQQPPEIPEMRIVKGKTSKYKAVKIDDLREKLGLMGGEVLLFPADYFVTALDNDNLSGEDMIHDNGNQVYYKKGDSIYPFTNVKEVIVVLK